MVALLPNAESQFIDGNGHPYAGGSLWTFVPGTTTPKSTWADPNGLTLNPNPITLDAAGRAIIYGDGIYRTQLFDALGNLVWDQLTNTVVSAAMSPVCLAADLPTALAAMGVTAAIGAEATTRAAADTALQNAINGLASSTALTAETTRATAAEATLTTNLAAEIARAEAAEAALGSQTKVQAGNASVGGDGHVRVNFATPFTQARAVTTSVLGTGPASLVGVVSLDVNGFDCWYALGNSQNTPATAMSFYWIAVGV